MLVSQIKRVNETVSTIYQELFVIQFVHAGYQTPKEKYLTQALRIEPDPATKKLFRDHHIDYRFFADTLVCFVHCTLVNPPAMEPKTPTVSISGDLKIRFLLFASSDFASRTYVVSAGSKKTYHLHNKISNTAGGVVFLTNPVENYSIANDYEAGTLVQDGGNLFSAQKTVLAADAIPISNALFWESLQPVEQVVNNSDLKPNVVVNSAESCFAVIDMFKNGAVNSSYKLFDIGDTLFKPPPLFTIKFQSMT
jgi:hypothetical protein